jgi:hypothetical protein
VFGELYAQASSIVTYPIVEAIVVRIVKLTGRKERRGRVVGKQSSRVDEAKGIIVDVGVAVPGLRVGWIDGGNPCRIGRRPAALDAVLSRWKIV